MQKNVSSICCISHRQCCKTISVELRWSVFCEAEMNPFCLDCTASCVVFLYLAKSNAFCFLSVPEPHTLFF